MLTQYAFVLILAGVALSVPIMAIMVNYFLSPHKPDPIKTDVYESGMKTVGDAWVQFRAQYYLIGLVFVLFDVEALFLFPIAVAYDKLAFFATMETILFILMLLAGLLYAWRKDALEWQ